MMVEESLEEWDAETYHTVAAPQTEWGRSVLAGVALNGQERVIDAGCGTGRLTGEILSRLPRGRVLAVDRPGICCGSLNDISRP